MTKALILPSSVDLSQNMGPVLDRCYDLIMYDQAKQGLPVSSQSRLLIYHNTRVLMEDSDVDNRTLLKALTENGFCDQ